MNSKISPHKISGLSSTLLIPLWAKAVEYERPNSLLKDAEAVRMLQLIDYDFNKFTSARLSQIGCCGRTKLFDQKTLEFIQQHSDAVVVQLGAGLDARFERLNQPQITAWYDLDLPEVIAIRRQLLPENNNIYLEDSLFNTDWMQIVSAHNKPVLLIIEGVLMYFTETEVKSFLATVAEKLPNATVIFDIVPVIAAGRAKQHDALKNMNDKERPEFLWTINDTQRIKKWHAKINTITTYYLSDICKNRYPWWVKCLYLTTWGKNYFDQRIVSIQFQQ
ncbi:MAG: class I SAM-dependent methyltransferase [Pasteurella oralis]|uniref:class I SAM-dependent methyltransferase n=1 Tax=Pasteurella oralis TaxID=1071947 RepID=UPI0026F9CE42|nr:class I SAM-dependent methyltransferase [Pasteurella oralis]